MIPNNTTTKPLNQNKITLIKKNMIIDILFLTMFYALPMYYMFRKAFNMHYKYSSDDPFYGSHTVAILTILAIVPVLNLGATIFQGLIDILEKNNKIK